MKRELKIIVATIAITGSVCYVTINRPNLTRQQNTTNIQQDMEKRFNLTEEIIQEEVLSKLKLNIADINFSKTVTIGKNNTFMNGWFKNQKHIKYRVVAHYSIDFSDIQKEQIQIIDNKVVLLLPSPEVDTAILEDKTEFTDEKGLLAIGEPKLTPQQQITIQRMLKESIAQEAYSSENMDMIKEDVHEQIGNLLEMLTGKAYKVDIKWL